MTGRFTEPDEYRVRNLRRLQDLARELAGKRVRVYTTCLETPMEGVFEYLSLMPPYVLLLRNRDGVHVLNWTRVVDLETLKNTDKDNNKRG